ncbi:hypothetical protein [Novosphingobium sp.]|uniref:hypothetical protein n=1 Tax=Novosphingobium sp. TaxID=1874826 RepID=UPI00261D0A25|nr:hypothetical protein [Novosphingobium sp.]
MSFLDSLVELDLHMRANMVLAETRKQILANIVVKALSPADLDVIMAQYRAMRAAQSQNSDSAGVRTQPPPGT